MVSGSGRRGLLAFVFSAVAVSGCSWRFGGGDELSMKASFAEFGRRAREGEALSVVFFGGSLTWGANASDPQRTSYRALMADYLRQKYPRAPLAFHDAAIGGTGSKLGIFRLERDVLSRKPDLVFLDFTANDDHYGSDLPSLAAYECILRELIWRGIPVVEVILPFQYSFQPRFDPRAMPRYRDHIRLATAYRTGVGDAMALVQRRLDEGKARLADLWPIDGVHPDDAGYALFFEAVRDGFEKASRDGHICALPPRPIFSDQFMVRQRIRLVQRPLPTGWRRGRTFRTSLWFDGLSSRWMDDVAICDVRDKAAARPLRVQFIGRFVGVFGEGDQDGLAFQAVIDGAAVRYQPDPKKPPQDYWPTDTRRFGGGRLFFWHALADTLPPGRHTLEIHPVFAEGADRGQLRIESICVAGE